MHDNSSSDSTPAPECPICFGARSLAFTADVLYKHSARFAYCENCGLLQAINPQWLGEAYEDPIAVADTGIVRRNISLARRTSAVLLLCLRAKRNDKFVDIAGGYGLLVRLMRDAGYNFYWRDLYCQNLLAKGFEARNNDSFFAATAFEVLEHVEDPVSFLADTLHSTNANAVLFSTELFNGQPPNPGDWWYYAFETGQHISFFQRKTLSAIADRLGLHFYSSGSLHLLSRRRLSRAVFYLAANRYLGFVAGSVSRLFFRSKTMGDHALMLSKGISDRSHPRT